MREQAQFRQVGKMCGTTQTPAGEQEHSGMFRSRRGLVVRCGASGGRECTQAEFGSYTILVHNIMPFFNNVFMFWMFFGLIIKLNKLI